MVVIIMILLRWRPWPNMLEGVNIDMRLQPIRIVFLLPLCHMWNNVRNVLG